MGDQSMAGEEQEEEDDDIDDNDSQTFIESNPMNNRRVGDNTRGYSSSGAANTSTGAARPRPLLVNPTKKITLASSIVGHASATNTTAAAARTPARADAMARATVDTAAATTVTTENDLVTPFVAGEDDEDEDAVFAFDSPDDKHKSKINTPQADVSSPSALSTTTTVAALGSATRVDVVVPFAASATAVHNETSAPKLSVAERVAAFQQKHSSSSSSSASNTASPKRHAASPLPSPRLSLASATTSLATLDRPYTGSVQPPPAVPVPAAVLKPDNKGLSKQDKSADDKTAQDHQQQQTNKELEKPVASSTNIAIALPSVTAASSLPSLSTPSPFFRTQAANVNVR